MLQKVYLQTKNINLIRFGAYNLTNDKIDQIVYEMNPIQFAVFNLLARFLNPVEKDPQVASEVTCEVKRLWLILSLFVPLNIDDKPDRLLTK